MVLGRITRDRHTDSLGGRHFIRTNQQSTSINPPIFMPDALPAATLPIYHGLGRAQEYAGLHTPVAWLCEGNNEWQYVTGRNGSAGSGAEDHAPNLCHRRRQAEQNHDDVDDPEHDDDRVRLHPLDALRPLQVDSVHSQPDAGALPASELGGRRSHHVPDGPT